MLYCNFWWANTTVFDCILVLRTPVLRQEVRAHYAKICKEIENEAMILLLLSDSKTIHGSY